MIFKLYNTLVFSLFLVMLSQPAYAQNYSDDITDDSTGIIKAVSEHSGAIPNLAVYAFDENLTTQGWANNSGSDFPAWISYRFPSGPRNVVAYSFYCSDEQSNMWPSSFIPVRWTLEGQNSEGVFILHSVDMAEISVNEWALFEFENDEFFDRYIFTFFETQGGNSHTFITEMELYEPRTVSTKEISSEVQLEVFPNPVNDLLTIAVENEAIFDITVFNELGQQIDFLNDLHISDKFQLDCSQYAKGIHSLHFQNNEGVLTKRVIIQ